MSKLTGLDFMEPNEIEEYVRGLESEVDKLRQELHQAKAEWFEEKKRAREAEQDRDNWMGVAQNNARESAGLREELEDLAEERDEYREQVQNFQDELASLHEQRESLYRESNKVFSEIVGLREQRAEMARLFEADEAAAERDHAELARLRQESAERLRIMVERGNEIARLREERGHTYWYKRIKELEDELARLRSEQVNFTTAYTNEHDKRLEAENDLARLRAFHQDPVEIARLREKVVLAQNVALAWGDGNNDRLQAALLSLFLNLYGQAPRNAVEETT